MNVMETVGMMSTGALVMLGGLYLVSPDSLPGRSAPMPAAPVQATAPTPQSVAPAPAPEPVVEVTRSQSDLSGSAAIGNLESFVALALRPAHQDTELTPAQEEIIAYFARTARDLNSASETLSGDYVAFNDMAINGLEIRHFYTVRQNMAEVPVAQLMATQSELVHGNLCSEPMMRTLIEEHGFRFVYSYVSQDNRFLGNVTGDLANCG